MFCSILHKVAHATTWPPTNDVPVTNDPYLTFNDSLNIRTAFAFECNKFKRRLILFQNLTMIGQF